MENSNFDQIFSDLKKYIAIDKCSIAQNQEKPLDCQWAKIGSLEYCKIHQGIKVK